MSGIIKMMEKSLINKWNKNQLQTKKLCLNFCGENITTTKKKIV